MSRRWRIAIAAVLFAVLGVGLSVVENEFGLSQIETLLVGNVVLFVSLVATLPWLMIGHGWIWIFRERKRLKGE